MCEENADTNKIWYLHCTSLCHTLFLTESDVVVVRSMQIVTQRGTYISVSYIALHRKWRRVVRIMQIWTQCGTYIYLSEQ